MAQSGLNPAAELGPTTVPWWLDWRGECAAIVASGPSANQVPLELLRDRIHVVAVNDSYKLVPWAEVLYSCDFNWWQRHNGARDFTGLRLSHDLRACGDYSLQRVNIPQVLSDRLELDKPTYVGAAGNSGFQAFNLAIQFGAKAIALIGVDCNLDNGLHWHGRHPMPLSNPMEFNVKRWREAFDGAAATCRKLDIDVVNCSTISKLTQYPKITIPEALERWGL